MIYFCSAAETENFAKAAQEHNVPPASISHSIKRLETELGVSLFDRSANGVRLNERGKALYQGAKASLAILEDARKEVREETMGVSIKLLVDSGRNIVNQAMEVFGKAHPEISFTVGHNWEEDWDKYDLVITDNFPFRKYYKGVRLVREEMVLVVNRQHPLAEKEHIFVQDLENQKLITTNKNTTLYSVVQRICGDSHFAPTIAIETDDPCYIVPYIRQNLGISILPQISWEGLDSEDICVRKIEDLLRSWTRKVTLICYNTHKYMSRHTKAFLDVLLEVAKEYEQ